MATSTNHQSPQSTSPALKYKIVNTRVWAINGTSDVVADTYVSANSIIDIMNTSIFVGPWFITLNPGVGFTVTSSNSEAATTTTYSYIIL